MPNVQEYQRRAAQCLRLARTTNDPTNKALLLEMAQAWVRLAHQIQARTEPPPTQPVSAPIRLQ
jgi:hypothetical protein